MFKSNLPTVSELDEAVEADQQKERLAGEEDDAGVCLLLA